MLDGRGVREARVGAAQLGRDARVLHGEALDVDLIQHEVGGLDARGVGARRINQRRANSCFQRIHAVVAAVEGARPVRVAQLVAMVLGLPAEVADDLPRMRVQQQLVRIEAMALLRRIGPVGAQAIDEAGADVGQEAVKDAIVRAVQGIARDLALASGVEDAEFDPLGMLGEDGEVHATIAGLRAQRFVAAFVQDFRESHGERKTVASGGRVSSIWPLCASMRRSRLPRLLPP